MSLRNSLIICPLFGDVSPYLLAFLDQLIFSSGVHMFASTSSCSLSISILSAINPCFLCFAGGAGAHSSVRLGVGARPSVFLILSKAFQLTYSVLQNNTISIFIAFLLYCVPYLFLHLTSLCLPLGTARFLYQVRLWGFCDYILNSLVEGLFANYIQLFQCFAAELRLT